jgi:hypothetical protein
MQPATFFGLTQPVAIPNPSHYDTPEYRALQDKIVEADVRSPQGLELVRRWNRLYLIEDPWIVPLAANVNPQMMRRQVVAPGAPKGPAKRPPLQDIWLDV